MKLSFYESLSAASIFSTARLQNKWETWEVEIRVSQKSTHVKNGKDNQEIQKNVKDLQERITKDALKNKVPELAKIEGKISHPYVFEAERSSRMWPF